EARERHENEESVKNMKDSLERAHPGSKIDERKKPKDMAFIQSNTLSVLTYTSNNVVYGMNKEMPKEMWVKNKDRKKEMPLYYKLYTMSEFQGELNKAANSANYRR
ncbi:hypothetical protein ACFQ1A_29360, partial [Massilia pinisoli]|uniref:hypothetical protein n=1 Tax=Massilia pinisoli TaxID=1772194 RepID=UPI0036377588